jgi:hypothetical protein
MKRSATRETVDGRLPQATSDLDAAKNDLDRWGYALVADLLSPSQLTALGDRLIEQADAECEARKAHLVGHRGYYCGPPEGGIAPSYQIVRMLPNKGQVFRDLILHPPAIELMQHTFGPSRSVCRI